MKKIIRYFKECFAEMKKVSWPTRAVVLQSTAVVIVSTVIFAIVLGLVDVLLGLGLDLLF
ncbi:MAG TPA: preprotein translocase subunit SecE [Candidatus Ornithospirochaeta stercorigallinarum]|nr:preprotein translocase subunit SecE [Candidatus Ornithospirochaeta stercorigallinarum]